MSLKLNERYPGRYNNPSADYPQGSFKNRTTPTAKDGSYLEQDWANDKEGFFQSLLSAAGIEADGSVDKVGASQNFDALLSVIQDAAVGRLINIRVFTASGTYNPTPGTKSIVVTLVGGGGAGGGSPALTTGQVGAGAGGGGGGWARKRIVNPVSTPVTVGAGGTPVAGNNGGSGGTTSFGSIFQASGGGGGSGVAGLISASAQPVAYGIGFPGVGTNGDTNGAGESGMYAFFSGQPTSGRGGGTIMGGGASYGGAASSGSPGVSFGSGGNGSAATAGAPVAQGGAGKSGVLIVEEYS